MADNKDLFGAAAVGAAPAGRKKPAVEVTRPLDATPGELGYTAASIEVLEGLEPVRRRPGMYIGGTDETALHHLFAEVLDNAMDEAVAGHATRIDVAMDEEGFLNVTDNGRGIPIDPHPKFPKKSALEVIMTTLHSGGKFDSGAYQTSGGLHGVGVSVVNALSERLEVEVARAQTLYRQVFERGARLASWRRSGASPTGAAPRCGSRPIRRSFAKTPASARRACSRWRGRRPICSAASKFVGNALKINLIQPARRRKRRFSIFPAG